MEVFMIGENYIIEKELDKGCYSSAANSISEHLVPSFLAIHPEYKSMFEEAYGYCGETTDE